MCQETPEPSTAEFTHRVHMLCSGPFLCYSCCTAGGSEGWAGVQGCLCGDLLDSAHHRKSKQLNPAPSSFCHNSSRFGSSFHSSMINYTCPSSNLKVTELQEGGGMICMHPNCLHPCAGFEWRKENIWRFVLFIQMSKNNNKPRGAPKLNLDTLKPPCRPPQQT